MFNKPQKKITETISIDIPKRIGILTGGGAKPVGGEMVVKETVEGRPESKILGGIGNKVAEMIEQKINIETRVTILGHLLRGGIPTPTDRLLAIRFGVEAIKLVAQKRFGRMIGLNGQHIDSVPIEEIAGRTRTIPLDSQLISTARSVGMCLGD